MISTNATMKPGRIYTLTNPVNDEVFYVGSTTQSLTERLNVHIWKRRMKYVKLVCSKKGLKINYSTIHNVINRGRCVRRVYYNIKYLIKGLQEIENSTI